jgi:hypothetical protein
VAHNNVTCLRAEVASVEKLFALLNQRLVGVGVQSLWQLCKELSDHAN